MDCVRVSNRELQGERYHADYTEMRAAQGSGKNACRQACVSAEGCVVWQYTPDQKCLTSRSVIGDYPHVQKAPSGTYGGLVECKKTYSLLKILWWVVMLGLLLVAVWYVLNVAQPRDYAKGETLLPRFRLTGPRK